MDKATRRRAYGLALKNARNGRYTQTQLGDHVGVSQGLVADWEAGKSEPDPEVAAKVEQVLGLDPGTLTRHLGYLPLTFAPDGALPHDVIDAILADEELDDDARTALLGTYRALTRRRPRR